MKSLLTSQEGLKLLACLTMLTDHIGAVFFPENVALRCIGRLSFPIYCFLLAEGTHYTKDAKKYGLRLLLLMVLSELPFEMAFYGRMTIYRQNVMLTLFMGFVTLELMKKCPHFLIKLLVALPMAWVTERLRCDYGGEGVMLIVLFALTRELPYKQLLQGAGMLLLFGNMASLELWRSGSLVLTMQMLGALSVIPISFYSGKKLTHHKAVQWSFNLFYPAHLLVLWGLSLT